MQVIRYEKVTKTKPKPEIQAREVGIVKEPEPGMLSGQNKVKKSKVILKVLRYGKRDPWKKFYQNYKNGPLNFMSCQK